MAYIVKERTVECPWCRAAAVVATLSCGCETVSSVLHKSHDCLGRSRSYFQKFRKSCGQRGKMTEHKDNKTAYA